MNQDYTYTAGKHWLSSVGGVTRQYDVAGNTTRIGKAVRRNRRAAPAQRMPPHSDVVLLARQFEIECISDMILLKAFNSSHGRDNSPEIANHFLEGIE